MQAETSYQLPGGEVFEKYKRYVRSSGIWSAKKLEYLGCPFYILRPELYKGVKNSACQGWGSHDISALRDHVHGHLPGSRTQRPPSGRATKDNAKTQDDIPRISESRIEGWKAMKTDRKRPKRNVQEEWWAIANVALGAKIPEQLPCDVHLAFWTEFLVMSDFFRFFNDLPGATKISRMVDNRSRMEPTNALLSPVETPDRGYSRKELADLMKNRPDEGEVYIPASGLDDSAYHGSELLGNGFLDAFDMHKYTNLDDDLDISDSEFPTGYEHNMNMDVWRRG